MDRDDRCFIGPMNVGVPSGVSPLCRRPRRDPLAVREPTFASLLLRSGVPGLRFNVPQFRRLAAAKRKKKNQRSATPAKLARRTARHSRVLRPTTAAAVPSLPKLAIQRAAA